MGGWWKVNGWFSFEWWILGWLDGVERGVGISPGVRKAWCILEADALPQYMYISRAGVDKA